MKRQMKYVSKRTNCRDLYPPPYVISTQKTMTADTHTPPNTDALIRKHAGPYLHWRVAVSVYSSKVFFGRDYETLKYYTNWLQYMSNFIPLMHEQKITITICIFIRSTDLYLENNNIHVFIENYKTANQYACLEILV